MMSEPYLEITYRKGRPFAAYLYLSRQPGDSVATSRASGSLVIDYTTDHRPIGIEIPSPSPNAIQELLAKLGELHVSGIGDLELAPLAA
jgi:hypothetical protein